MRDLLDRWFYRRPFEGASARRYAADERPAFGDLDARLIAAWPALAGARRLLDVGAGPAAFAGALRAVHPRVAVTCVEPSRDLARAPTVRAVAEDLPFAGASFDLALCLSSIRHVHDRARALTELRRVVRPGGALWIVELDPRADRTRCRNHAAALGSLPLRLAFRPLVVRTAPTVDAIATLAHAAGWRVEPPSDDPVQPVYVLRCT